MKKLLMLMAMVGLLAAPAALAHDADPVSGDFDDWGKIGWEHDPEQYPWKGTFTLTANNTGTEAWGEFYFAIFDPQDPTADTFASVFFDTDDGESNFYPLMDGMVVPAADFDIYTNQWGNSELQIRFWDDLIEPGEDVTFVVYTDNTTDSHSFFGVQAWPGPIPEPATVALLGLGAVGLTAFRKRRP